MMSVTVRPTLPSQSPWRLVRRGIALLPEALQRKVAWSLCGAAGMAVLEAAAFALLFVLIRLITDEGAAPPHLLRWLGSSRGHFLAAAGGVTVGLFLARGAGNIWLLRVQSRLQATLDATLSTRLFRQYLALPYIEFTRRNSADMITNISWRVPDVAANTAAVVVGIGADSAVVVGVIVTLAVLQPLVALGVFAYFTAMAAILLRLITPAIRRRSREEAVVAAVAQRFLQEGLGGIKAIKANELADAFYRKYSSERQTLKNIRQHKIFLSRLPAFYLESAMLLGVAVLALFAYGFHSGHVAATFGILVAAAFRILPAVNRILTALTGIRSSEASLERIEADLVNTAPREGAGAREVADTPPVRLDRALAVRNLSFHYPGSARPALAGIDLLIRRGEMLGVVGLSGAGKTTLVDVVLGLLVPTGGSIYVDDVRLDEATLPRWRDSVGYVPQEVFLLDSNLRDNITFGRTQFTEADLQAAVSGAELEEVVGQLPEGLDTVVGERGVRLSGGQRQRIGIARALISHPSLLILDEATAALDNKTEAAIVRSLEHLRGEVSLIVIAHRLSTVRECDRIAFLDKGHLEAVGDFMQLARTNDRFAELVRLAQLDAERSA